MGHMMKRTMVKARSMLQSLTIHNGVDGSNIYIYCEGWDFGEVAKNGRGINASQFNLSGTGIGRYKFSPSVKNRKFLFSRPTHISESRNLITNYETCILLQ
ncbi:hypothetical protein ACS0TY_000231 [Phlomoides rotata]